MEDMDRGLAKLVMACSADKGWALVDYKHTHIKLVGLIGPVSPLWSKRVHSFLHGMAFILLELKNPS